MTLELVFLLVGIYLYLTGFVTGLYLGMRFIRVRVLQAAEKHRQNTIKNLYGNSDDGPEAS